MSRALCLFWIPSETVTHGTDYVMIFLPLSVHSLLMCTSLHAAAMHWMEGTVAPTAFANPWINGTLMPDLPLVQIASSGCYILETTYSNMKLIRHCCFTGQFTQELHTRCAAM